MEFEELIRFIELENQRLNEYFNHLDPQKQILARTVKLGEEAGELCSEVLAYNQIQRKEKLENYNPQNLPEEFADVIITTLLLARVMNVNVEEALEQKIEKVNQRYKV